MPRGGRTLVFASAAVCAGFLHGRAGFAAELPGARLDVVRDPGSASCPDSQAIADALRERLGPTPIAEEAPIVIEIEIRSTGAGFTSTVRASGGKRGVRTLSAPGPSCDALREALLVSLLVLLDRDPEQPERPAHPAVGPRGPAPSFWLGGGIALTGGLPEGLSAALSGELGARYLGHSLWVGALWTPEREIAFEPGFVEVSAFGGQLRACTRLLAAEGIRLDGCALGALLSLRGKARGYTVDSSERRPWWLAGAGVDLGFEPVPWLSTALAARLLISPHPETFSIGGLSGTPFETETVIGWLGLSLSVKIW